MRRKGYGKGSKGKRLDFSHLTCVVGSGICDEGECLHKAVFFMDSTYVFTSRVACLKYNKHIYIYMYIYICIIIFHDISPQTVFGIIVSMLSAVCFDSTVYRSPTLSLMQQSV